VNVQNCCTPTHLHNQAVRKVQNNFPHALLPTQRFTPAAAAAAATTPACGTLVVVKYNISHIARCIQFANHRYDWPNGSSTAASMLRSCSCPCGFHRRQGSPSISAGCRSCCSAAMYALPVPEPFQQLTAAGGAQRPGRGGCGRWQCCVRGTCDAREVPGCHSKQVPGFCQGCCPGGCVHVWQQWKCTCTCAPTTATGHQAGQVGGGGYKILLLRPGRGWGRPPLQSIPMERCMHLCGSNCGCSWQFIACCCGTCSLCIHEACDSVPPVAENCMGPDQRSASPWEYMFQICIQLLCMLEFSGYRRPHVQLLLTTVQLPSWHLSHERWAVPLRRSTYLDNHPRQLAIAPQRPSTTTRSSSSSSSTYQVPSRNSSSVRTTGGEA